MNDDGIGDDHRRTAESLGPSLRQALGNPEFDEEDNFQEMLEADSEARDLVYSLMERFEAFMKMKYPIPGD